ncbi:MAG TPA: KOW motif-containing protein, partial [Opitutaceae bacterium]|nr:KOW motif-containing protein [Opitutaceae bacterium]
VVPLFPRYVFCRFDLATAYRAVKYAPDASDIVLSGRDPATVSDTLINDLKEWADDVIDGTPVEPPFQRGDRVEIIGGPMRGVPAVILHTNNDRDRVAILLSILQHGAQMTISRAQIQYAG